MSYFILNYVSFSSKILIKVASGGLKQSSGWATSHRAIYKEHQIETQRTSMFD